MDRREIELPGSNRGLMEKPYNQTCPPNQNVWSRVQGEHGRKGAGKTAEGRGKLP